MTSRKTYTTKRKHYNYVPYKSKAKKYKKEYLREESSSDSESESRHKRYVTLKSDRGVTLKYKDITRTLPMTKSGRELVPNKLHTRSGRELVPQPNKLLTKSGRELVPQPNKLLTRSGRELVPQPNKLLTRSGRIIDPAKMHPAAIYKYYRRSNISDPAKIHPAALYKPKSYTKKSKLNRTTYPKKPESTKLKIFAI